MAKCPYCAEEIQDGVQVCPFCRSDLAMPRSQLPHPLRTCGKATVSLVLGIASLLFSVPAAVVAIFFGHLAKAEIRRRQGRLSGKGMATAGLVLGYFSASLLPFMMIAAIAIPNLLRAKIAANEASAVETLRVLNAAAVAYSTTYGSFPPSLASLGPSAAPSATAANLIDSALAGGEAHGYIVSYDPETDGRGKVRGYTITAQPGTPGSTGQRYFFTDQSGVIRANMNAPANERSIPISLILLEGMHEKVPLLC